MFMFDVETLGVASDSVVLSMACIQFDPAINPTYKQLKDSAFFVKFDAKDQVKRLHRKIDKSTVTWWSKQCLNAKIKSLIPSESDVTVENGIAEFSQWVESKSDKKSYVWARGNLDEIVLRSLEYQVTGDKDNTVFAYSRWRDVRTAIDFLTGNLNGYCTVDHPEFNFDIDVTKHNPIDDCASDIMMLIYGKSKITT